MEEIVIEEFQELANDMRKVAEDDLEVECKQFFNTSVLNILWHIVTGKRFDRNDPKHVATMRQVDEMFSNFGTNNVKTMLALTLVPKFLRHKDPYVKFFRDMFQKLYATFQKEYEEHEATFDANSMRDFTDAYINERNRVKEANETNSSFYGQVGYYNYVNSFFDLFLAGSETTSTSLNFTVMYLLHFPSIQKRLQDELDKVVGRSRLPSYQDRTSLPYVEAFIAELQRHTTIVPLSVQHVPTEDVTFRGYKIPKNTVITPNIGEVMMDPVNFPNPKKFDPERFLDDNGNFKPHKALIYFGIGKRECLGKSLAKMELFILTSCLLHQFTFEPGTSAIPDLNDVHIGIARSPANFKFRIKIRQ